jgi:alkanesulfonate monooxygenase
MAPLRFHWMLVKGGEQDQERTATSSRLLGELPATGLPDLEARVEFCRDAEASGIDSLLMPFGYAEPDPIPLAAALGLATRELRLIVAYRSGLMSPVTFVQQINTLGAMTGGRIALNIVAGHSPEEQRSYGDFLDHDERYRRTAEFLAICGALWDGSGPVSLAGSYYRVENARLNTPFDGESPGARPEIYVGGHSPLAREVALAHGSCWMRMADTPAALAAGVEPFLAAGRQVGLRLGIIARPTRPQALAAARELVGDAERRRKETALAARSDSQSIRATLAPAAQPEWLDRCLWTGAVPYFGVPSAALVGTPDEVAAAFVAYGRAGISQFILHGWPKREEMLYFGREVLPRVRELERQAPAAVAHGAAAATAGERA